jgi:DNA-directed RNA polymerase specialized sigma24 family protein
MRARPARRKRACSVSDTLRLFAKTRERLARLTDDLRIALSLVVVDGLSYEEAAERLNVSMPEYLSRLAVAREALGVMVAYDERPRALAAE